MSGRPVAARPRPRAITLAAIALLLAGCGSTATNAPASSPANPSAVVSEIPSPSLAASPLESSTPAPTDAPRVTDTPAPSRAATGGHDPCGLLTTEEAAAALGVASTTAKAEVPLVSPPPGVDAPAFCSFAPASGGGTVTVGVDTVAPQMVVFALQGTAVPGIGEQAIVGNGVIGILVSDTLGLSIRVALPNGQNGSDAVLIDLGKKATARAA